MLARVGAVQAAASLAADVFPGAAAENASAMAADAPARIEAARHGWRVLAVLSALMGFASISTDLYLPALTYAHAGWTCIGT